MILAQQITLLILGAGVTGAFGMWCVLRFLGYARWARYPSHEWEEQNYQAQKKRLRRIQSICNKHMDGLPPPLRTMDRKILVSYEDLLKIWDISDKIEEYL